MSDFFSFLLSIIRIFMSPQPRHTNADTCTRSRTHTHTLMTHATDSTVTQFSETFGPILSDSVSHATLGIIRPHSQHRFKFCCFLGLPTLFDIDDRLGEVYRPHASSVGLSLQLASV